MIINEFQIWKLMSNIYDNKCLNIDFRDLMTNKYGKLSIQYTFQIYSRN